MAARTSAPKKSAFVVTIRSTERVVTELDRLAQMGLFGKTRSEVAEELMRLQLRDLHREGWLDAAPDAAPKERP